MEPFSLPPFAGFTPETAAILDGLLRNNERAWFHAHKDDYRRLVTEPLTALAEAVRPAVRAIDADCIVKISRPQRDTRFSHNKAPYRCTAWLALRRPREEWTGAPCYFLEVAPEGSRWGMGFYAAAPSTMAAMREAILHRPERWQAALDAAVACGFALEGDEYKRPRKAPAELPAELGNFWQRRTVALIKPAAWGPGLFTPAFADDLAADFTALGPIYRLWSAVLSP